MSISFIRRVLRAWDMWRMRHRMPRQSPEACRLAERIAKTRRDHKSARELRLKFARTLAGRQT